MSNLIQDKRRKKWAALEDAGGRHELPSIMEPAQPGHAWMFVASEGRYKQVELASLAGPA